MNKSQISLYTAHLQDSNGWMRLDENIPHHRNILVCVPIWRKDALGKRRLNYDHSVAWWSEELQRWDSELHYAEAIEYKDINPVYWKPLDLPVEYAMNERYEDMIEGKD